MIIFGVPSSFCLFSSYVHAIFPVVVPVHLQRVDSPVVYFLVVGCLAADLHWSVELLVGFLG